MCESIWKLRYEQLESRDLARHLRVVDGAAGPVVSTPQGDKLLFCSNDYLGLAAESRIRDAVVECARRMGTGAAASRLVCGNTSSHRDLERRYADFVGTQDAVLFASGYQANVGALQALAGEGDVIFSDARNHASIIDGCRLSGASVEIYEHGNTTHLRELLEKNRSAIGVKMVVTDAIFSMDGDMAPIGEICRIASDANAHVYLDEAHSLGVLGPGGRGLAAMKGLSDRISVQVGTLGKAVGVCGALVACSSVAAGLLRSGARSLMYSTAPPSMLSAGIAASLDIIETAKAVRDRLVRNIAYFKRIALGAGLPLLASDTPIQPIVIGDSAQTMRISEQLWEQGVFVQGIRPPTVSEGTSRLRVTITATHREAQMDAFVALAAEALLAEGVIR